jgi:aldose sugar dehydrogenase
MILVVHSLLLNLAIMYAKTLLLYVTLLSALLTCKKKDSPADEPLIPADIKDTVLSSGLSQPWEILWGPDNFIWMTERSGKISRVNATSGVVTPVHTITEVVAQGEGGLLGMTLHPDFTNTPHVFVVYNYSSGGNYREKVVRFTYGGGTLTGPVTIQDNITAAGVHNGSRLQIGPDAKLYITTGDAANTSLPQQNSSLNGKVLRLNLDGSVPADNPIAGNPLWSSGHRNPQGLVFANGKLYSSEHGPDSDDEVNIIEKGRNYGWPSVRGFCEGSELSFCTTNNVKEPVKAWTPTIATAGLDYYNNNLFPQWKNSLLLATLKNNRLYQLKLDAPGTSVTETNEFYNGKYGRLRDICIAPDGKVYLCTGNGSNDKIIVLSKR